MEISIPFAVSSSGSTIENNSTTLQKNKIKVTVIVHRFGLAHFSAESLVVWINSQTFTLVDYQLFSDCPSWVAICRPPITAALELIQPKIAIAD